MQDESEVQQRIQIEAAKNGCLLMRNNSGALEDTGGRTVRYGLGNISKLHNDNIKSSDLVGITTVVITPDMVGKKIGIFTAIEVKKEDWSETKTLDKRERAQKRFIDLVRSRGGLSGFANNLDSLLKILRN